MRLLILLLLCAAAVWAQGVPAGMADRRPRPELAGRWELYAREGSSQPSDSADLKGGYIVFDPKGNYELLEPQGKLRAVKVHGRYSTSGVQDLMLGKQAWVWGIGRSRSSSQQLLTLTRKSEAREPYRLMFQR